MQKAKDLIGTCNYCLGDGDNSRIFSIAGVDDLTAQEVRLAVCYAAAHISNERDELCEPAPRIKELLRKFDLS